jgi:DNA-binding Lrp family transcriptional regulator
MLKRPLDTLLGFKALSLVGGLNENDRRVGATLLEHFNRKTGQCDPSLGRIARLLEIDTRTVIRSVRHLEEAGILRKYRHGGHLNRNQYEPIWPKLSELEVAWNARFKGVPAPSGPSPSKGQTCHLGSDSPVTQTCSNKNLPNETCSVGHPSRSNSPISTFNPARPAPPPSTGSSVAMRSAAERRWNDQLLRRFASQPLTYGDIVKGIDTAMQEAATDAELVRHGAGFAYIIEGLGVWTGRAKRQIAGNGGKL